ncbi:MAG: hypothetical protein HOP13_01780, partial [Alphaproteobacteria bacterium]|nr:hypothetical protein [Alphaproteobacteria bacterium]
MTANLIRIAAFLFALSLGACSTYKATVDAIGDTTKDAFTTPPAKVPTVDLTNANWQKLTPDQPEGNPLRVAIVERNEKIGATRVVLKAPAAYTLPPYWLTAPGNYTVLKGTFVFGALTANGKRTERVQTPGTFAEVPKNYILQGITRPGTEALLYITVYGEWAPKVAEGAWT